MASSLEAQLRQYGVETMTVDLGPHVMDGQNLRLPPLVFGRIGDDKSKRTILIYGHYDVQPVRFLHPRIIYVPHLFSVRRNNLTAGTSRRFS